MTFFFENDCSSIIAVECSHQLQKEEIIKLQWLFNDAKLREESTIKGLFVGPRKEMITPWSTNAVEITQNMGLEGITRIEEFFFTKSKNPVFDRMLQRVYQDLDENIFKVENKPAPIVHISDIEAYNEQEGLALSPEEIEYLKQLSEKLQRPLTDSEVFGFSQVNSEHCRHKIFNGTFIIDGEEKPSSLFKLIKKTSQENPNKLVSAYKDNVAFVEGPTIEQFAPKNPHTADFFEVKDVDTVISLKAETHNFPTTVEPFNGAATGTGGEIRDRLGGGRASLPIAGTAVYMTSYPRTEENRAWEVGSIPPRKWLYQTPEEILIKASNGASDFGNKFGQPLICGSVLTFEDKEGKEEFAYDKVIMLAGGVGFAAKRDAIKGEPDPNQSVVLMGGDNYRIGMGGGAVSSVNTGQYANSIELNAVQRANPEMQKRVSNVIRALSESDRNPIVSIHDHGAGGHLNALSELVESTGGNINIASLPVGDPTLSSKEIVGNESQERMGMIVDKKDVEYVRTIAERERAPFYVVGETTNDHKFVFTQSDGVKPIDLAMDDMFGSSPKTFMVDSTVNRKLHTFKYKASELNTYLENVLQLEAVACKDWLTNKVDRSVTGKIARQQCQGEIQLPLSDCGVVSLDYTGTKGIATSIGHAPQIALADSAKGSVAAIAESLTNIVGAPLSDGLKGVSLSANWMWPCRNEGEDAALYRAVQACSDFACKLGINIPTGKDSLSMTQKYGKKKIKAPGTVIISAAGEVSNVRKVVSPVLKNIADSKLYYIDFSNSPLALGGSAFAQTFNAVGQDVPEISSPEYFAKAFNAVQALVNDSLICAMHDISAGGLITTVLEMNFANMNGGVKLDLNAFADKDVVKLLFAENSAVLVQIKNADAEKALAVLAENGVNFKEVGQPIAERIVLVENNKKEYLFDIDFLRDVWFKSLSGSKLGIWVAHGEGKFVLPEDFDKYNVVAKYSYNSYPANPNGSPKAVAGLVSNDGRHLAMMPHLERAIFPWQCGFYPNNRMNDEVTPWIEAFVNALNWIKSKK